MWTTWHNVRQKEGAWLKRVRHNNEVRPSATNLLQVSEEADHLDGLAKIISSPLEIQKVVV